MSPIKMNMDASPAPKAIKAPSLTLGFHEGPSLTIPAGYEDQSRAIHALYKDLVDNPHAAIEALWSEDTGEAWRAFSLAYFQANQELCRRKEADYGRTWGRLGSRGLWVFLDTKIARLKNLIWFGKEALNETPADSLVDLFNYTIFAAFCEWKGNRDGSNWKQ